MTGSDGCTSTTAVELIEDLHARHTIVASSQRQLLETVAQCDKSEVWRRDGARDTAEWLSAHLGISNWAARRWINAAHALPHLPVTSAALDDGTLCLDKVLELCRFATPEDEARLITWARRVTVAGIRRKADLAARLERDEILEADRGRYLRYWWFDDGKRLGIEGALPADQGAVVAKALDRMAGRMPDVIECDCDDDATCDCGATQGAAEPLEARRADALVALASAHIADDHDADRAMVVIHADLDALAGDKGGSCEIECGPVIDSETALRLACDAAVEVALHNDSGATVGVGRTTRKVPRWLLRQLRQRDGRCRFPGCEARHFLHAHHIIHWARGGPTELVNLTLLCSFHHRLVHEYGWGIELGPGGTARWFRPNGREYEPRPRRQELVERTLREEAVVPDPSKLLTPALR